MAGTGLGLGIVRRLVEAMGGEVHLESEAGHGVSVCFSLPMRLARERRAAGNTRGAQAPAPLSALLVEDDPVNQAFMRMLLQHHGYEVHCVSNGRQAVDALTKERYDIVLMDLQMPELDGLEATRRIRHLEQTEGWPPVPIVAVTAHAMLGDREHCLDAGMDEYIAKPLQVNQLLATLERVRNIARPH